MIPPAMSNFVFTEFLPKTLIFVDYVLHVFRLFLRHAISMEFCKHYFLVLRELPLYKTISLSFNFKISLHDLTFENGTQ